MPKRQLITQLDEETLNNLRKVRDETGLPISRLIDLRIRGYKIVRE